MEQRAFDRRRLFTFAGAAAVALALPAHRAAAGRQWCKLDPEFRFIDAANPARSILTNVTVAAQIDDPVVTTGPIELTVTAPEGITVELVSQDAGFGFGYAIQMLTDSRLVSSRGRFIVSIATRVPASTRDLVRVEFAPAGAELPDAATGWTNELITLRSRLQMPGS